MKLFIYQPHTEYYWSESDLFVTTSSAKLMTRNHFCLLLKFLHFSDNRNPRTDNADDDKLYKISDICDSITSLFESAHVTGKQAVTEEGMI